MGEDQAGSHTMRVRVRLPIWHALQELAELESERVGSHVTVSDLVRGAVYNLLLLHQSFADLQACSPKELDFDELVIDELPLLSLQG